MRSSRSPATARLAGIVAISLAVIWPATTAVAGPDAAVTPDSRQAAYSAAADRYGVPLPVLLSVSYLESRWDTNSGLPSTSGGFGPMHLTDVAAVTAIPAPITDDTDAPYDARGDDARATKTTPTTAADPTAAGPAGQTLDTAAGLTGETKDVLRADPAANIRGGAALLAAYQQKIGGPSGAGSDPAAWYGAVAQYAGSDEAGTASAFADDVYQTINDGMTRTTDDGSLVTLTAAAVTPDRSWLDRTGLPKRPQSDRVECPKELNCEWIPAPYQLLGDGSDPENYGNHDLSDRPHNQNIRYIVLHDTEGSYAGTINMVQDPTYVSWQYTIRSNDGHVAQHLNSKDVAWQAGNWYINATSIGIEQEGYAARQGAWYTEALYRASSTLVRYLAHRFNVPLDRAHIIGHDNVPGITPGNVAGMHWDPGPYWDWTHYFDLLKAPLRRTGDPTTSQLVMIKPDYASNQPQFTGCTGKATNPCPLHGSTDVILRSGPRSDAPLVKDEGLHKNGGASTMVVSDHSARAATGQVYALADAQGDWTAIWYLGQKAWFYNPASAPTAVRVHGSLVVPKAGRTSIPVYGRAYPEAAAYPAGVSVQALSPLQYTFAAGQAYSYADTVPSEYYRAWTFDGSLPGDWTVIRGQMQYVEVQFGHRVMFVNLADVDIIPTGDGD